MKKKTTFLPVLMFLFLLGSVPGRTLDSSSPVPVIKTAVYFDISPPLKDIPVISPSEDDKNIEKDEQPHKRLYPFAAKALPKGADPVWQRQMGSVAGNNNPLLNFEGNPYGGFPPDCNGEAGPNHYFQIMNSSFQIFSKTGTSLYGPASNNNIWPGSAGQAYGGSDAIVLYDQLADRWLVADITLETTTSTWYLRVALSQTPDPLGSWYRWIYSYGTSCPDFPKFGVWRDGYYFACNLPDGINVGVLEREAMLAGKWPARFIQFNNTWNPHPVYHCIMPFDNDGIAALSGTPGQFATINDDAWNGGSDQLWLYTLNANWTNPDLSTFTRTQQLDVAPFDANFGAWMINLAQKGTTQKVDAAPCVLRHKAQYRNFGSYQSLVCCHTVDVDNTDHAGVRWYELRRTTGEWYIYQQGTYAPDGDNRWMGGIAQNQYHDIAIGYSAGGANTYASIRYAGRKAGDPLGTMTIAEQSILDGTISQQTGPRWGDYSGISVDPADDKTFWYTNQYMLPGDEKHTRIAQFSFGTGCTASGGCDEYISRVQAGTIDNSSGCLNYADYSTTQATNLPLNSVLPVTVTNGNPYTPDQCGIWVDWNRNGSFSGAGEQITVSGQPGIGPYTAVIIPPAGQTPGICTMRVRITYTGSVDPCGDAQYGEVEDYAINVSPKVPNVWTGAASFYWNNSNNWSLGHVPTADEDATITSAGYQPATIDFDNAVCLGLKIESGELLNKSWVLDVNNSLNIYGKLSMDDAGGEVNVYGNVTWFSGSTAGIVAEAAFRVYGDWIFNDGANVPLHHGTVEFRGSNDKQIKNFSPACSFNNVLSYNSDNAEVAIGVSTQNLLINGSLDIYSGSVFTCYDPHLLLVKGDISCAGKLKCYDGTIVIDGITQNVIINDDVFFNNLEIFTTGAAAINNSVTNTIVIKGNLEIVSGVFNPMNNTIEVAGNWTNNIGPSAFMEGTGKVIFNGGSHQYCSTEIFNNLEVNKPAGAFRVEGGTVTCNSYDWTAGAVDVLYGTFTANTLADNAIAGSWYLNTGGTINLYNMAGWVDLKGYLNIYGGNFNVYGGSGSDSYWPFSANGGITMSGGTLDFKNVGVLLYNTPFTFAENITNGTIRTSRGFRVERSDFTPDGGTIEFYGPTDGTFHTINGGYVKNVNIHKSSSDILETGANPVVRDREQSTLTAAVLSNTISIDNSTDINGYITIQSGVLSAGNNAISVEGDWNNLVGTEGFTEGTSTVIFNGAAAADILSPEVFCNMNLNKSYASLGALELMNPVICTNDLHIIDGSLEMNSPSSLDVLGNLTIDLNAGLNANDSYGPEIYIGGNWTNANTDYSPEYGFDPGNYSTVMFQGSVDQYLSTSAPQEFFNNLTIRKFEGSFKPNANIQCLGNCLIDAGTWEDNVTGLTHTMWNNFTVAGTGTLANFFTMNTIEFKGMDNAALTYSGDGGYFHHLIINKSTGISVTQVGNTSCQFDGNLTIENGIFNMNGNYFFVDGNLSVNDAGTLSMPAASLLKLTDAKNLNVNSGGRIEITGTAGSPATISANTSTARYNFSVNAGASIAADYCTFKNMGINGVNLKSGSWIDPAHSFNGCTFRDGAASGTLLTINNGQLPVIRNAVFPANTWGGTSNVSKTLNAGHLFFVDFSGGFSGEDFDKDDFNLVDWVPSMTATATATPAAICAGSTAQLNTIRTGGMSSFTYLWSPATGLSNATIINPVASPLSTTTYHVTVTDALGTTASSNVSVTVNPPLPVSVSIAASLNPSPPGTVVTFSATPVNGGSLPAYQWKVNGENVAGITNTYAYIPSNNDQITCSLISDISCPGGNPAMSNTITMMMVAVYTSVTGTVSPEPSRCFDATNTITVAGGGNTFLVQSGGSARFIAGMKISFLPQTTVDPGGYMHGYITSTNAYCGSLPPALPAVAAGEPEPTAPVVSKYFMIYPNPTTGIFTIELKGEKQSGKMMVELYDLRGEKLLNASITGDKKHEFSLSEMMEGLYFVKIVTADGIETFKLVKTR